MAKARQSRRVARDWAWRLGLDGGREAVDDYVKSEQIYSQEPDVVAALRATQRPGQEDWSCGAANADTASFDGCPAGYEDAYYDAYDVGAAQRVREQIRLALRGE